MGNSSVFLLLLLACSGFSYDYKSILQERRRQEYVRQQGLKEKAEIERLGDKLKKRVQLLRDTVNQEVELVFLVDSSGSVGIENFFNELKFVKKLLADFTVTSWATRVALVTFSSKDLVVVETDHISRPNNTLHKCSLFNEEMPKIEYRSGGTYTVGAFQKAVDILRSARRKSTKAVILITDGYSNGPDPQPEAEKLRRTGVHVFTFGIRNGNVKELRAMASEPKDEHCYILDSFEEFEKLARRALHEDLGVGELIEQDLMHCSSLCAAGKNCCDSIARCVCGIHTGQYQCMCPAGYYGNGLKDGCQPCSPGTYKPTASIGGITTCLKCPDGNHISPNASTSLHQCVCKDGFSTIGSDTRCREISCPRLSPPPHGYFVGDSCSNMYNSACGLVCQAGYELMGGDSVRRCEKDGTWSGDAPYCRIKLCQPLSKPVFGRLRCDRRDYAYGTTCTATCNSGYQLVGTRRRECLAIKEWSGLPASCRAISCQALPEVENGMVNPPHCTSRKSKVRQVCVVTCNNGYERQGPKKYQCEMKGQWTDSNKETECIDIEPPKLTCPIHAFTEAQVHSNIATVLWKVPSGEDNSDDPVSMTVVPAVSPPHDFRIGVHNITYIATDKSGNKAQCSFLVIVRDTEPPVIDRCRSPSPILSADPMTFVSWEQPRFSDNSNEEVTVVQSHYSPDMFSQGMTVVEYKASDSAGNSRTCHIIIQVQESLCEIPEDPLHGNTICTPAENGIDCALECLDGYGFAITPNVGYYCDSDGAWYPPQNDAPWPDCSGKRTANHGISALSVNYRTVTRNCNVTILSDISDQFTRKLADKIGSACSNGVVCELDDVIARCDQTEESINVREFSKNFHNNLQRRKRALRGDIEPSEEEDDDDEDLTDIYVDVLTKGTIDRPESQNEVEEEENLDKLLDELGQIPLLIQNEANARNLDLYIGNERIITRESDITTTSTEPVCVDGTVLYNNKCINCAVGTFYNVSLGECQNCPIGTYQTNEASLSCQPCPANTSTEQPRSRSQDLCYPYCSPGTFSSTGLEQCEGCDLGYYQPNAGSTSCVACPHGTTTAKIASATADDCREPCEAGKISRTGVAPCYPCPKGYYQPSIGQFVCFQCPDLADTDTVGATSQSQCEGVDEKDDKISNVTLEYNDCFTMPCQNDGNCESLSTGYLCECQPGYTGAHCESDLDECESNPCLNNATCIDKVNSFICNCPPGFTGDNCGENINECSSSPCRNGGTCLDDINAYQCICILGFRGTSCEIDTDECDPNPCQNGTCYDMIGQYRCECTPGFSGRNCDVNTDECASNPCQNDATCKDGIGQFSCECIKGYEGEYCEVDINECGSSPCHGGATCLDMIGQYQCVCPPAFSGVHCENELPSNFSMVFEFSGTVDFVEMYGMPNLTAFTIAFWMKTADRQNYGTVLSYAVKDHSDNTLVITDYNGFVLYVNGNGTVTDATANDNTWHHIAATWTSESGQWLIYKDGVLVNEGTGLASKEIVPGGGVLIVGQEQDYFGGGFSAPESFVGKLSLLNIWDKVLSKNELFDLMHTCEDYHGTVKAWPDFLAGIQGRVYTEDNGFCQGCRLPEMPPDGSYTGGTPGLTATPAQQIHYRCNAGFDLLGPSSSRCRVYGKWTTNPKCNVKSCGYPGILSNGQKSGTSYYVGDVVTWKCNAGFNLVGNAAISCTVDGVWSGKKPVCKEIKCGDLPQVEHATVSTVGPVSREHGAKVNFACEDGYQIEGSAIVWCELNGLWSTIPKCKPVECGQPEEVSNSVRVAPQGYTYKSSISYTCETGFMMYGDPKRHCQSNGKWSGNLPVCQVVQCGQPLGVPNGKVSVSENTYQGVAEYWCDDGYLLKGSKTAECTENGNWTIPPYCEAVHCGMPDMPVNGDVPVTGMTLGHRATYQCYSGYILKGLEFRRCETDGTWSGQVPTCEPVLCGPPHGINNGDYSGSVHHYGSIVTFTCDIGHFMSGNASAICKENGEWSTFPTCSPVDCGQPDSIRNAEFNVTSHTYGSIVVYHCHEGSKLTGSPSQTCQEDGTWSADLPSCDTIDCGPPPDVANASMIGTLYTYRSVVVYSCENGFDLIGSSDIICQLDAQWTPVPVCEPVDCGLPPRAEHAIMSGDETKLGSHIYYTCMEGYESTDNMVVQCQEDRSWSPKPTCAPFSCGQPWSVANSFKQSTGHIYNSTVSYTCMEGYQLIGNTQHICQADKTWSGKAPVCQIISCGTPSNIEQVSREDAIVYGSSLEYECLPGYNLQGEAIVTCQANGLWTDVPSCVAVECGEPSSPNNGFVSENAVTYGSVVHYGCDEGYNLKGSPEIRCLADGSWSNQTPVCEKLSCGLPQRVKNSDHSGLWFFYGNKIHYTCDEGYEMHGNDTIECLANGEWSEGPACSIITCGNPNEIENGTYQLTGIEYNDMVTFSCDLGYQMVGTASQYCLSTGIWGGEQPKCEIIVCGEPQSIEHGIYTASALVFGGVAEYSCIPGYSLTPAGTVKCEYTGNWSHVPVCLPVTCKRPSAVPNGTAKVSGYVYGKNITYACVTGYLLQGHQHITCEADATWSGQPPRCEIVQCGPPVEVHHATVTGDEYEYGKAVKFQCQPGYKMLGNSTVVCQATGKWTIPPVCSPLNCGAPPSLPHGAIHGGGFTFNQTVSYSCDAGYSLRGNKERTCQADGVWGGEAPDCEIISCGRSPIVHHASKTGQQETFGSVINYRCDAGYRLSGNQTIICLAKGVWTTAPVCNPVECGPPEDAQNSFKNVGNTTFGNRVTYHCNRGYILEGDSDRVCLEDGSWSGKPPKCQIVTCGKALPVEYASHNGTSNHAFGDVIHYKCDEGYERIGHHKVQCSDTGEWTAVPACHPVSCGILESIPHGRVLITGETYRHNATYACDTGHRLQGISVRTCQASKRWSDVPPRCNIVSCGLPPDVIHSTYDDTSGHTYNSVAVYKCDTGYNLIGNSSINCKENGQWAAPPVCTPVSCDPPETVENAYVTVTGNFFRQKILFQCERGYQLIGDNERECLASGKWSGTAPLCHLISCGLPYTIENGEYNGEEFTFGSSVTYQCHEGYELKGSQLVRCLENGLWTQEPTCTPVLCKPLEEIQHANAVISGHTYGGTVSYTCERGYTLNGDTERVCQANGEWGGTPPVCEVVTCGPFESVQFAARRGNSNTYESIVRYLCIPGYELRGEATVRCLASGSWGQPPTCVPITCRQLHDIPHGSVSLSDVTFGTIATYECEKGYRLRGSRERKCQATGAWSGSLPVCQLISCGTPEDVPHATFSGLEYTFGSSVFYTCDTGYRMIGESSVECVVSGQWTTSPACEPVNCGPPLSSTKEIIIGSNFLYGQVVEIDCILGFEVSGEEYIWCQANGEWSAMPECVPVDCREPKDIPHATVNGKSYTYGSTVYYECDDGYELIGSNLMVCQASGEWTAPPTCEPITCSVPPPLEHASMSRTGYSYTDVVTYHCNVGYRMEGADQRECEANGHWSGVAPKCLLVSCGPPKRVTYATLLDTDYTFHSIARYSCQPGYELVGTDQVICSADGEWSPEPPECQIVNCPAPLEIVNGQVHGTNYSQSSVISYTCHSGYKLIGVGSQTCLLNKTWSYKQPNCELIKCRTPDNIAHGRVMQSDYFFDSTIEYVCNSGYELNGSRIRRCLSDSTWSGTMPTCTAVSCGAPPSVDNGEYILQHRGDYTLGNRVQYICNPGFIININEGLVCRADGIWHGTVPVCSRKSCSQPSRPPNGMIKSGSFLYGDILEYGCLSGYNLIGTSTRRCQSTGQWSGSLPTCEPVSCGPPPVVQFASVHTQHLTFNSLVSYSCNAGYEMENSNFAKCLASGTWSDVQAQCIPVSCGPPPLLRNGNFHGNDFTFGQSLHYYCHPGYTLQGSSLRHCSANGRWNGTSPRCTPIQCGSPPPVVSGTPEGDFWSLGNTVHYRCYPGYTLTGNSSRTCQANGQWSGQTPLCEPISCGSPPGMLHGFTSVSGGNYNYGEYVVYVCQDGYILSGNSVRHCQADGSWSGGNLTCRPVVCAQPSRPNNGRVSSYDNSYSSRAYFSCDDGYVLQGQSHRVCLATGEWSGHMPRCEPNACGNPPHVSGAVSLTSDNRKINPNHRFFFRDSIKFLCQQGYRLEGNAVIQCNAKGQWTLPPACEALSCNAVASIANGYVSAPSHKVNATIAYGCRAGYELHGRETSLCQPDQTWSNPPPVCQPVSCGTPHPLINGFVDGHSYLVYNSIVKYKCINGYVLVGNETTRCQATKTWTTLKASCEPVECGPPPDVQNAIMSASSGQHFGITVTYTCEKGFQLDGAGEVLCAANGRWQGTPRCVEDQYEDFQHAVCILPCLHGGTCIAPYQCKCPPGFSGTRCENALCHSRCMRNGRCYGRNRCRCPPGRSCDRKPRSLFYL
ncbi:LOW QUALITY PROTEIN: sushi, von Willebrand factor type A, EGF and pentraxin domain-containing protein 1-like [Ptychodera flava]|uniref:LOW QUALITY PROTEIN: sushi, von Willebrand factor type A, EGF and pentraxin domain-containing protein 1-like n=1 Tax=Ptychodera flava TaxID=63121 RepID=UPI003969FDA5